MSEDLFYIDVLRSKPIHIYDVKLFLGPFLWLIDLKLKLKFKVL